MLIINPGFGISGWFMNEHFSAKNIPFEIKYFHFIPFHSIPKVHGPQADAFQPKIFPSN